MVRDLIRQVQNLRKDSGLIVEDRINIALNGTKDLHDAVNIHKSYFMNEVLGVKLDIGNTALRYKNSIRIDGKLIEIAINLAN